MSNLELLLVREPSTPVSGGETFTPGKLYADNVYFCETCEDEDRFLENDLAHAKEHKVYGRTAIPRGRYEVVVSRSAHFSERAGRDIFLPELLLVPTHDGIRMHGANRAEDLLGCIGCGTVRTSTGIAQCAATIGRLVDKVISATQRGERSWITVK